MTSRKTRDPIPADHLALHQWYTDHRRDLPWRTTRDPYRIWLSETMLQQTTTQAVIPYFERFLTELPTLDSLAKAPIETVLRLWSGLGYYSRARNLHQAAQMIAARGSFPENHAELMDYPGLGPYTARAVASLAFGERVGVLDGNVIRVLSRRFGLSLPWWTPAGRQKLQILADEFNQHLPTSDMNQALMELGSTVCTPKSPRCGLCPWIKNCVAYSRDNQEDFPLKKPKRAREIWIWETEVHRRGQSVYLQVNDHAPFLKGHWLFPGKVRRASTKPKGYDFKHTITHHDIYVRIKVRQTPPESSTGKWIPSGRIEEVAPTALIKKVLMQIKRQE